MRKQVIDTERGIRPETPGAVVSIGAAALEYDRSRYTTPKTGESRRKAESGATAAEDQQGYINSHDQKPSRIAAASLEPDARN
jgi:hypothetical protein